MLYCPYILPLQSIDYHNVWHVVIYYNGKRTFKTVI
nr:MAG TPA: hypothetical protein [Caudoviricetes sp.]